MSKPLFNNFRTAVYAFAEQATSIDEGCERRSIVVVRRGGQDEYCSSGSFGYRSAQGLGGTPRVNGVSDMLFSAGASPAPGLLSTGAGLSGYSSRLGGLSATAAGLSGLGRGSSLSPNQQQQLAQDRRIANAMLR